MVKLIRWVANILIFLIADVQMINRQAVPRSGGCLVAANHLGRLDAIMAIAFAGRDDVILMIAEKYQKQALWRFVARHLNAIWLNRFEADFHALREVQKRLKQGELLAIAPEGTRSPTESLQPGKPGVIFLAAKANLPIIPVAIYGTEDRVVKQNLRRFKRTKVIIQAGEPYLLPPMERKNRDEYLQTETDELMCRIAAMLPLQYRGVYADHPRLQEL